VFQKFVNEDCDAFYDFLWWCRRIWLYENPKICKNKSIKSPRLSTLSDSWLTPIRSVAVFWLFMERLNPLRRVFSVWLFLFLYKICYFYEHIPNGFLIIYLLFIYLFIIVLWAKDRAFFTHSRPIPQSSVSISGRDLQSKNNFLRHYE